jgi:tetratricopeptide (TPR) repeat protein
MENESQEMIESMEKFYKLRRENPNAVQDIVRNGCELVGILRGLGRYEDSLTIIDLLQADAEQFGDIVLLATVWRNRALIHWTKCDFQATIQAIREALRLSKSVNDQKGVGIAERILGVSYQSISNYPEALEHLNRALDIFSDIDDKQERAIADYWCGVCYTAQMDIEPAMNSLLSALETFKTQNFDRGIADTYNSLGILFINMKIYDRAQEFFELSLQIRKRLDEKRGIADVLNNLGMIHRSKLELDVALDYYAQSLAIHESLGSMQKASNVMTNIGSVYEQQGYYEKSLAIHQRALQIRREINYTDGIYSSLGNIATVYLRLNRFDLAYDAIKDVVANIESLPAVHKYKYYELYSAYCEATGDVRASLDAHKKASIIRHTLFDEARIHRLSESLSKFLDRERQRGAEALLQKNIELERSYAELKRAQNEIVNLEKRNAVLAMAVTANHELNQPLMIASGNLEMLAEEIRVLPIDDSTLKHLRRTQEAIGNISDILKRFRTDSQIKEDIYLGNTSMWVFPKE